MKKPKKHLLICWHGLTVGYDTPPTITAIPHSLCNHITFWFRENELKSIKEVIKWVETVRQPKWGKVFRIGKFQISISKYW